MTNSEPKKSININDIVGPTHLHSVRRLRQQIDSVIRPYHEISRMVEMMNLPMRPYAEIAAQITRSMPNLDHIRIANTFFGPSEFQNFQKVMKDVANAQSLVARAITPSPDVIETIQNIYRQMDGFRSIVDLIDTSAFNQLSGRISSLHDAGLFDNLHNIIQQIDLDDLRARDISTYEEFDSDDLDNIEREFDEIIHDPSKANQLSPIIKHFLIFLFLRTLWPIMLSLSATYAYDVWKTHHQQAQEQSVAIDTKQLARDIRAELSKSMLSHFRLISGDAVRLRDGPKMKSKIITLLPRGAFLEIIDNSNRSWLLVEVRTDEEMKTGWVSRRYTKRLH